MKNCSTCKNWRRENKDDIINLLIRFRICKIPNEKEKMTKGSHYCSFYNNIELGGKYD